MKKYFVTAMIFLAATAVFAQKKDTVSIVRKVPATTTPAQPAKKDWSKVSLARRANDHFMFELGYDNWAGTPDSIHIQGFNRSVNVYFMFDFPFKTDPRFSIGAGLGIGSSNIFFHQQEVLVAEYTNTTLAFPDESGNNHYKKFKLVTTYLESPVELRFAMDPEHTNSSWKFAVGAKFGLLLSAYTKAKDLLNSANQTLGDYIQKESSKQFFNSARVAGTARINKGPIGVFGQFNVTSLIKANAGPTVFPFSAGIVLSGL